MSGPFGMDPELMESCTGILSDSPQVRLRGVHAHLASGLDASAPVVQSSEILAWCRAWLDRIGHTGPREFNLDGGMPPTMARPRPDFDLKQYGAQRRRARRAGRNAAHRTRPLHQRLRRGVHP